MSRPLFTHTSDGIGSRAASYHVMKYHDSIRRSWALVRDTGNTVDVAAYFRTEAHARQFAAALGLTITERNAD